MTLLVLSDSHGRPDLIEEAIRRVRPDGILFAGDGLRDLTRVEIPCPLWAVSGNCDWLSAPLIINGSAFVPQTEELVTVEGIRILLTHGHKYGVKSGPTAAAYRALELGADILVYGHTHVPVEYRLPPAEGGTEERKPLILFNPGSIGDRDGSFGTITIRNGVVLCGHGKV
jgi:putative phosphoesterase